MQARPIIFFPECTRSNGRGVLEFPEEAVNLIQTAINVDKFKVHALRFDYIQTSASIQPYNSTDIKGWKHAIAMLSQLRNTLKIQYLFNLQSEKYLMGDTPQKKVLTTSNLHKKLKEALFSPGHEYNLDKNWHDHQEFLKYWNNQ